jgi:predicted  nucleic acid-binding Zn-ribbon protein
VSTIKEQLETLVALQHAEIEIRRIEQYLAGVDERVDTMNSEVKEFEDTVFLCRDGLAGLKQQYRSDENEIKVIDSQIAKSKEKLRSVKTNKEYQSILKEIDDLKRKSSDIEDRMLEHLERAETADGELAASEAELVEVKKEVAAKQEEIRQIAEEHRKELEGLQEERDDIWQRVDLKLQKFYTKAKQQGHGIAIAGIVDAVCQVCRMNIPPQQYNELLRLDSLRMCPNCQRIIYPKVLLEGDATA